MGINQRRAIVVGSGIGGLAASAALAENFSEVFVLERDTLPLGAMSRAGVPHGKQPHVLLLGTQRALEDLFPGFERDLGAAGAVPLNLEFDGSMNWPRVGSFPRRDFGMTFYAASRPLVENTLARRVSALPNVKIMQNCRCDRFVSESERVFAVSYAERGGESKILHADLIVDATGRHSKLTLDAIATMGLEPPEETEIDIDIAYTTAIYKIPEGASFDWKYSYVLANPPDDGRSALLIPIEGGRWMVTLVARHGQRVPSDPDGFVGFAKALRTPLIFDAIKNAELLEPLSNFVVRGSRWRHFERLGRFPSGLLPIGDTICGFNPVYGQGMCVAAQQAVLLRNLLGQSHREIHDSFFAALPSIIAPAWSSSIADFAYPKTGGVRPADLDARLRFSAGIVRLAASDASVHKLFVEVFNMLRSPAIFQEPDLRERILTSMTDFAPA
ncbi:hypothetical protein ACOSOMT5_P2949 [Acidiphilium sp. MT5]